AVVAACNGLVLAGLLCSAVAVLGVAHAGPLALTLGLTMLCVVMLASANGALIPFALQALGIDPASAMGPFVTTLNDILGLTVYFLIASMTYL
ncbi:MAG: magnesium transporter, partial [Bacteroidetes bacterium QS_9_68_14]